MQLADLYTAQAREALPPLWGPSLETDGEPPLSLAYGLADPALFPQEELVDTTARILASHLNDALNYAPVAPALTTLIAERLHREGVQSHEDEILVAYGSSQILGLLPRVLIEPGDTVLVEAPTFMGAVRQFKRAGAQMIGLPVDAHGLDVEALATTLEALKRKNLRPKFLYTIPTFQNPAGVTLSLERRQRIVELAAAYGVLVVEDDAYVDLRFRGEPLPPMAALDQEGWVLRVGTFSKILAPGLRVGWAHGPRELIARLQMFKLEGASSPFVTHLVARFSANGRLEQHITDLCAHYAIKCATMSQALRHQLPEATFIEPDGGFFIWLQLPQGVQASELAPVALKHGVEILPGTRCYTDGSGEAYIRLAFSELPGNQIETAIRRLSTAIKVVQRPTEGG
ncbi:PLP-dependent aminotransferase family protein [Candidatus Chloroploca sp. M-50]|uniref:PLP-dependent aminotransferase family protein n=1 Tax=Candidatus Chloroploca mongolica TaxID=2528176 RepID=A0ABS4DBS1_9CHLR|nr:PLP-dependent aminotransferase family protein [Candidatus Chloroploca mongolica]MBP1466894.1 PLP-dependent aminotransferase family protein [Candidatus Chloroploca mongolica]